MEWQEAKAEATHPGSVGHFKDLEFSTKGNANLFMGEENISF